MTTALEIYASTIRNLPHDERLRLAALILNDLAQMSVEGLKVDKVDTDDAWSEEDQRDLTNHSLRYADILYPEEEDLVQGG